VLSEQSPQTIEADRGGWLRTRRNRLALWIAAGEGVIVAVSADLSKWTVVALAAIAGVAWMLDRNSHSSTLRHALWIFVVSQLIAVVLVSRVADDAIVTTSTHIASQRASSSANRPVRFFTLRRTQRQGRDSFMMKTASDFFSAARCKHFPDRTMHAASRDGYLTKV